MNFEIALMWESLPKIVEGMGLTLELLFLSLALGTALAVCLVLMRISGIAVLEWPAFAYIYIFRGTPMLVQLFVVYYGVAQFEFIRESPLWVVLREPFWCAIITLSLNEAAYTAEIFRGGIQGVERGLHEAGRALGLKPHQRFLHVTAPIAIRLSLPAYGNEIISLLKGTALVSLITMHDITGVARTIVAHTFAPYEIFVSAAIVYLCLTWVVQRGIRITEHRFGRYVRG
ncbi:MAG: ABC transporter permease subunit [Alphaproteobacteria bacterium]|nr:ABC transporter permease subunit [Alphaproteobacteria bacterium]